MGAAVRRRSVASKTICARVLSRTSRVTRYRSSKSASCSGLRAGISMGFMGSSSAHKLTPLGINLFVLSYRDALAFELRLLPYGATTGLLVRSVEAVQQAGFIWP